MRAAVTRRGVIVADDMADPKPGPGEALVAVRSCGICGSDLHTLQHASTVLDMARAAGVDMPFDPDRDFVMGHELTAEVLELGPGTDGAPVAPGDVVTSVPALFGADGPILLGFSNEYPGGYAERMLLTAGLCTKLPDGLDHRRAALTEPMAVGRHAVNRAGHGDGDAALVFGCGPIGLAVIADLSRRGVDVIVAADFSPLRRAIAAAMGATEVVDPAVEPAVEAWRRVDGQRPLVVYEAVGVPGVLQQAITDAPPRTRVCVVGVCMEEDRIQPMLAVVKELDLFFSFGADPFEFADTLQAIAEGTIDVSPMITGVVGVEGVAAAFEALRRAGAHVKILVEPGGPSKPTPVGCKPFPAGAAGGIVRGIRTRLRGCHERGRR